MACILQVFVFNRDTDDGIADTKRTRGRRAGTVKALNLRRLRSASLARRRTLTTPEGRESLNVSVGRGRDAGRIGTEPRAFRRSPSALLRLCRKQLGRELLAGVADHGLSGTSVCPCEVLDHMRVRCERHRWRVASLLRNLDHA
jgi:hypothetical protein